MGVVRHAAHDERGFTLPEVIIAMLLVSGTLSVLAGVVVLAIRVVSAAQEQTATAILAAQKVEELRASLTGTVPATGGALAISVPGFADWIDASGQATAGPSSAAVYVRRWATGPAPGIPDMGVIQVLVSTVSRDRRLSAAGGPRARHENEALLVTFTGRR